MGQYKRNERDKGLGTFLNKAKKEKAVGKHNANQWFSSGGEFSILLT
jgi:hypothetical protein